MATVYSVAATKAQLSPPSRFEASEYKAGSYIAYDSYTAPGAIGAADVIKFMKLPPFARIIEVTLSHDDLGATGSCKVGYEANGVDVADDDAFLTAVNLNAAANTVQMSDEANVPGFGKQLGAETQVSATMTAVTTVAGTLKLAVHFVID